MAAGKPRRVLLSVNEKSRSGAATCHSVAEALSSAGILVERRDCERSEDLPQLIRDARTNCDGVVVGGGDGTMNAALPGILDTGLPLGIVPLGTANDLARTLGLPSELGDVVQVIAAGHRRRIDIGEVNHKPFLMRSKTLHLAVGNGRHYGGGMTLSEDAAIDDNRLHIYSL